MIYIGDHKQINMAKDKIISILIERGMIWSRKYGHGLGTI
jgi:hypothetical protein